MPSTHRLQANFTNRIGQEFPTISGLKTLVYFGTGGDGVETNRASGGPALSVLSGTPVHSSSYVSLGNQPFPSPTRSDNIDTNNFRDATMLAAGWTWMACARTPSTNANYVPVIFDQNQTGSPQVSQSTGFQLLGNT